MLTSKPSHHDVSAPETLGCPDPACGAPAEILDRWTMQSTDGPVEMVKTRCANGHVFTPLVETAAPSPEVAARFARQG